MGKKSNPSGAPPSIHEQLVELLCQYGDCAIAQKEARHIHAIMLALPRGHDIGQDESGFYARPRQAKPPGPAKDFRDLAATARKAIRGKISREDWMREWAAQPRSVWRACRPFLLKPKTRSLDRSKLLGNFSAPGFATVVPKPEAVLPALEVALELRKIATGNKKQRKPDLTEHDVIAAVQSAYSALTGKRGGRAILPSRRPGRLVRLGHDIDRLFGTKIFPKVDSSRLKQKSGDKKPFLRSKR
jgi:hypothetical protein